jgi:hypothetical protein
LDIGRFTPSAQIKRVALQKARWVHSCIAAKHDIAYGWSTGRRKLIFAAPFQYAERDF